VTRVNELGRLEAQYAALEGRFRIEKGLPDVADAVQFKHNRGKPVHRWFTFKEGFSADLLSCLDFVTDEVRDAEGVFVDPFAGCGTTLVAADLQNSLKCRRLGVEINPFLAFVARTKASWREFDPARVTVLAESILAKPLVPNIPASEWPALSTFRRPEVLPAERASALVDASRRIDRIEGPERDLLRLGLASAVERVGFFRRDGRALRTLRSDAELAAKKTLNVAAALSSAWLAYADDLVTLRSAGIEPCGATEVIQGDARTLTELLQPVGVEAGQVDAMVYSPPYFNHIDYTEVYKLELWLLGFLRNRDEMLGLRKSTLRSHGSVGVEFPQFELPRELEVVTETITSMVTASATSWHSSFGRLLLAYLADMHDVLESQHRALRAGGKIACVIGNSAHGSGADRVPVAVDLLLVVLAEEIGFRVERVIVARQLRRRDHLNRYLRESVLILTKVNSQAARAPKRVLANRASTSGEGPAALA